MYNKHCAYYPYRFEVEVGEIVMEVEVEIEYQKQDYWLEFNDFRVTALGIGNEDEWVEAKGEAECHEAYKWLEAAFPNLAAPIYDKVEGLDPNEVVNDYMENYVY